jgi:hypothetical protein
MKTPLLATALAAGVLFLGPFPSSADPVVPGFVVDEYATVGLPMRLSFDETGALFVGSNVTYPTPGPISRVDPGGGAAAPYGPALLDPDAVIVHESGSLISATDGSVFVGGVAGVGVGHITEVLPDETGQPLFGPGSIFLNPTEFAYDSQGRLLISDIYSNDVYVSTGGNPVILIAAPSEPYGMALDALDRVFLWCNDGVIRIYDSTGALQNNAFVTGINGEGLAFGPGGAWGNDLYAIAGGELLRIDGSGAVTVIGTGFSTIIRDVTFGPDDALYVSDYASNRVLRVLPGPVDAPPLEALASGAQLFQNAPNPFARNTDVAFALDRRGFAEVDVYDLSGRLVRRLHSGDVESGPHTLRWNGLDERGRRAATGTYFVRLSIDGVSVETRKALLRR